MANISKELKKFLRENFYLSSMTLLKKEKSQDSVEKFLFKVIVDRGTEFAAGTLVKEAFLGILLIVVIVFFSSLAIRSFFNYVNLHILFNISAKMMRDLKREKRICDLTITQPPSTQGSRVAL